MTQKSGVLRARTIDPILSVTEAYVCPGPMTGGPPRAAAPRDVAHARSSGASSALGLSTFARYVVRGRVPSSARRP